jgi:HAAS
VNDTVQDDIAAYVAAVRAALAGLPEATRDELLEDLPEHLAEVTAEDAGSLVDRLGAPEAYAAELRATAGFVGGFPDPPADRFGELRDSVITTLTDLDGRLGPLFGSARASDFLVLLRPAWWVLRGYVVAMVLAAVLDDSGQPHGLLPRIGGSELLAALLLAGAVLTSIWLGRRTARGLAPWPRFALYAGTVFLVLAAFGGFVSADSDARGSGYADTNYSDPYGSVRDVFVYDEQGRLVTGARLFDQDGQPIRLGQAYCDEYDGPTPPVVDDSKYPFCGADRAPFKLREPSAAPAPTPSK